METEYKTDYEFFLDGEPVFIKENVGHQVGVGTRIVVNEDNGVKVYFTAVARDYIYYLNDRKYVVVFEVDIDDPLEKELFMEKIKTYNKIENERNI